MIIVVDVHDCFDDDVCLWVDDYDLMIMVMISTWCYMMMFMSMIKMMYDTMIKRIYDNAYDQYL
jgi:hypothetical protein